MTRGKRQGISGDLAHESARDGINRPLVHRSSGLVPPILHIYPGTREEMLQKSLGERHVAVTSDKGSAASGGRWQEQIMCGASLFEKPPASIHGQVIGRNRRNSLIPVLSYCCSLLLLACGCSCHCYGRPIIQYFQAWPAGSDGGGYCVYLQNLIRLQVCSSQ